MAGFFNADNKLWSSVNAAVDAILLNIMWLITCIPVFTIGAATTAFYYTTHKVIRNQRSGIWREYWASFKANFKQATKTWLIFLAIFAVFYFDINICIEYLKAGEKIGMMAYFFYGLLAVVLIWFLYVFASLVFLFLQSKHMSDFYRCSAVLMLGMTTCLIIYTIFPNAQPLRPDVMPRDNFLTRIVAGLYEGDTPTNVCPSIHVYNSIAIHVALFQSYALQNKKGWKTASLVLCILICLSTMFLKQHSIIDVVRGLAVAFVWVPVVYRSAKK